MAPTPSNSEESSGIYSKSFGQTTTNPAQSTFTAANTGLPGISSGDPFASFLIGAVDNGNVSVHNVSKYGAEQLGFSLHVGDTWKVSPNLTFNYGVRWDKFTPTYETSDQLSFFSFAPNPGAGNLPG